MIKSFMFCALQKSPAWGGLNRAGYGYPHLRGKSGRGWTCCGARWETVCAGNWILSQRTWPWSGQKSQNTWMYYSCLPALAEFHSILTSFPNSRSEKSLHFPTQSETQTTIIFIWNIWPWHTT